MQSKYVQDVPVILADMEREREEADQFPPPQEAYQPTLYRYQVEGGGTVISNVPLEDAPPPVIDADEPATGQHSRSKPLPLMLHVLLLLFVFVTLDNLDTVFAQFAPTVTVTITPVVKTLSTTATLTVGGAGADIPGRLLAPLTLSQAETVKGSGHGHQDATRATGTLIYFNGSFAPQTVEAGTVYTGSDGVQVATNETVTVPPATPGTPPQFGQASVPAHAILAGAHGNIRAGDITVYGSTLQVSNSQFQNGQDARDFSYVKSSDIQGIVSVLTPRLVQSEQAALTAQLRDDEAMTSPSCTSSVNANRQAGEEAQSVTVAVAQTCNVVAYNPKALQTAGASILTAQAAKTLGRAYTRSGDIHLTVTGATNRNTLVFLSFALGGTWVYMLNETYIKALIVGKGRLTALHLLAHTPGVQAVSVAGGEENTPLPTDPAYIHVRFFAFVA